MPVYVRPCVRAPTENSPQKPTKSPSKGSFWLPAAADSSCVSSGEGAEAEHRTSSSLLGDNGVPTETESAIIKDPSIHPWRRGPLCRRREAHRCPPVPLPTHDLEHGPELRGLGATGPIADVRACARRRQRPAFQKRRSGWDGQRRTHARTRWSTTVR